MQPVKRRGGRVVDRRGSLRQLGDRQRREAYGDCFCCKPNTTGLRSHVVLMCQSGMVGICSYIPTK